MLRAAALAELLARVWGEWVCAGVCAVERASEPRAPSGEEQPAPRSTRSAGPAGQLGGGWAVSPARPRGPHWPPAGRPPPGRRRGTEGLLRSRSGRARPSRRRTDARDPRPHSLPPCAPAAAPLVPGAGAYGRPPTAPRRDPGSSRAPG